MKPTISFDLDAVLIQNPFLRGVLPHLGAHLRAGTALCELAPDEADERIRRAVLAEVSERMAGGDLASAYDWDSIYGKVAASFGAQPVPDVAELVRHYCGVEGTIWLLEGADRALSRLADAGYRLITTTNGFRRYQEPVLEALGILDYFDDIRTPEATGFAKPDPRILDGVEGLIAHVGDMLFHDVLLSRRLGIGAIWIHEELPPDLRDLPPASRTADPKFEAYLEEVARRQPYAEVHPEAASEQLRPDHVLVGVFELDAVDFTGGTAGGSESYPIARGDAGGAE